MTTRLKPQHEDFCQYFALGGSAADAAREAGYDYDNATNQAYRLLQRPDVQARLAELEAEEAERRAARTAEREAQRAAIAALGATKAEGLIAKLDPVYEALLEKGAHDQVMKVVRLQAVIAGRIADDSAAPRHAKGRARAAADGLDIG